MVPSPERASNYFIRRRLPFRYPRMAELLTLRIGLLVSILVLAVLVARSSWRNRPKRGARTLGYFMTGVVVLAAIHLVSHVAPTVASGPPVELLRDGIDRVRASLLAALPVLWFAFVLEYTDRDHLIERRVLGPLFAWPAILTVLIWVPELAAFVGIDTGLVVYERLAGMEGPVFWIYVAIAYALFTVGSVLTIEYAYRTNQVFRKQGVGVLLGVVSMWAGSAVLIFGLFGDLSQHGIQFGLFFSGIAFYWAVHSGGLTDIAPVARSTILENLGMGVVVVDEEMRVIDTNPAARRLLGRIEGPILGKSLSAVLADRPNLLAAIEGETGETEVRTDDGERVFRVAARSLDGESGTAVLLEDVTQRKQREQDLNLMKQVFSRVLRHNIRNELNVVKGHAQLLETHSDGDGDPQEIIDISSRLIDIAEKARAVEQAVEKADPGANVELVELVERVAEGVRTEYPEVEVTTTVPERQWVYAHVDLGTAIENVVENAAQYNDADDPWVEVRVSEAEDGWVELRVEDNGPGIPADEVTAITEGTERDLLHGSGIGLHLTNWIVTQTGGDVSFDRTDSGTRVTLRLRAGTPNEDDRPETPGGTVGRNEPAAGE